MKTRLVTLLLSCAMLMSGCSNLYNGSYSTIRPHEQTEIPVVKQTLSAHNKTELQTILKNLISAGKEDGVVYVEDYDQLTLQTDMRQLSISLAKSDPVAAYALETITFEFGKQEGRPVLSLNIRYTRNRAEILGIRSVANMERAAEQVRHALARCDTTLVLKLETYEEQDLLQIVEDYAVESPHLVMEVPQVSWEVYPKQGQERILEVFFTYQTSREALRSMQEKVEPVFASAALYVSGDASEREKYSQLYSFLMERYEYKFDTSITPAYSLLRHGVGDSRAFALVYARMCRQADLECLVVSGTKDGESRYWNIICREDRYYHVDLLSGRYKEFEDEEMTGYVWDYSAYPVCSNQPEPREPKQ